MTYRLVLLIGVLMLILAACGDSDQNGDSTPVTSDDTEVTDDAGTADATEDDAASDVDDAAGATEGDDADATEDDDAEATGGDDAVDDAEVSEISGGLTVFAAASLTDAFEEMLEELAEDYPDLEIALNFAGSSALRTQLEEGAEADVFASANVDQMDGAIEADRIDGEPVMFVQNRLVLIVPADNPGGIESLVDLVDPETLVVFAQEQVPVGDYSREALDAMSQDPEFGEDFKDRVLENLVSEEPNVRAVVTRIQLGEADAGIVYASDVTPGVRDDVIEIEIPDEFNVIAEYPVAQVEGAPNPDAADMFIEYLMSSAGQEILERWGFIGVQ